MTTAAASAPTFWSEFDTELTVLVNDAKAEIAKVATSLRPLVAAGAQEVASAAFAAVLTQAPLVLSGTEKLSAATSNVVSTLAASGKSVAVGIAQTAVQSAYSAASSAAAGLVTPAADLTTAG
jgi:hypothetical protein